MSALPYIRGDFNLIFDDPVNAARLYQADCLQLMNAMEPSSIDMIFADPPYFLSNGGITCKSGRMALVDKGGWDQSRGAAGNHDFNLSWLRACRRILKPNATIWVSGTAHVIHSVGFAMQQLGFRLLNDITWVKPNPPPNLSCRYFTHATETIIWAARDSKSRHTFQYAFLKSVNDGKQMKSVWTMPAPAKRERLFGRHPTQKPVALVELAIAASTNSGDVVFDPFAGSGTTAVAALRLHRSVVACERLDEFSNLALRRICARLAHTEIVVAAFDFSLDLFSRNMDRSSSAPKPMAHFCDLLFHFVGRSSRKVIFSVLAGSLDDAIEKFHEAGHSHSEAIFIISTETQIYLA